jgi:hypothetical protein
VFDRTAGSVLALLVIDCTAGVPLALLVIDRTAGSVLALLVIDRTAGSVLALLVIDCTAGVPLALLVIDCTAGVPLALLVIAGSDVDILVVSDDVFPGLREASASPPAYKARQDHTVLGQSTRPQFEWPRIGAHRIDPIKEGVAQASCRNDGRAHGACDRRRTIHRPASKERRASVLPECVA